MITLDEHLGWVVTSHHPDILNYVGPGEVDEGSTDVVIGLLGRSKRDRDAKGLRVVHVVDKRGD